MRNLKTIIAVAAMALCGANSVANAQCCGGEACKEAQELGYKPRPYGFVQLQGGDGTTVTDVSALNLLTPTFSVAGGYMFTPAVGARLHINGIQSTGGFKMAGDPKYKFNYINTNADLMFNITNLMSASNNHAFNLYVIGGVGLNYAWNNDEFDTFTSNNKVACDITNAWGDKQTPRNSLLGHNIRFGVLGDYNISKNWSVGAEVDLNSLDDRFNSKYNNSDDWMLTAQVSLTYKFGFKKPCKPQEPVVVKPEPKPEPVVEQKPEPKPEPVVVKEEPLKETFFYNIRLSDPEPEAILNKIVAWCKKYPNKQITVDGYADKGTGNPEINVGYAKARATKVAQQLEERGVPKSQMIVNSYGDKVQPFAENDRNRCVIVVGGK